MFRVVQFASEGSRKANVAWQRVNRQPRWVVRIAVIGFLLVIGIPLALLVLLALLVATALFMVLWLVNRVLLAVRGVLPVRDGRSKVRVIQHDNHHN